MVRYVNLKMGRLGDGEIGILSHRDTGKRERGGDG